MDKKPSRNRIPSKSKSPARKTPSKIFPNPFLNFLRDFRKSNKQKLSVVEITRRGAQLWRGMSAREKSPYRNISKQAPKYTRTRSRSSRKRGRRRRRKKSKASRRKGKRRRRGRSRSSSFTEESVERKDEAPKSNKEPKHEKDQQQTRSDGNSKEQNGGCNKNNENRRESDDELRFKSVDYDDIRRDYI